MRIVRVQSAADIKALDGASNVRVEFDVGIVTLPELTVLHNLKNVTIDGSKSPKGRVAFTGFPLQIINCENVTIERVAFHLERSTQPPQVVEKWWSSPRFLATRPGALNGITLRHCEFRHHTDEIAFFHADNWIGQHGESIGRDLLIEDCVVGPSLRGKTIDRINHNFGLMVDGVDAVTIRRCVFAGNNRRNPQVRSKDCLIEDCLIVAYGTHGIAAHAGSEIDVRGCVLVPTERTSKVRPAPVKAVEGTTGAFPQAGLIRIAISGTHEIASPKHRDPRTDLNCWSSGNEPVTVQLWDGTPQRWNPLPVDVLKLPSTAGVQDSASRGLAREIAAGSVPWRDLAVQLVRSDYE